MELKPYSLPLRYPLTSQAETKTRNGILVGIPGENGQFGWGDCAPLPGLHTETLEQAKAQLLDLPSCEACYPSVQCALDMARQDLAWQQQGGASLKPVRLNGLVMAHDEQLEKQVTTLVTEGYRSIKIKVGRQTLEKDIHRVQLVQQNLPEGVSLRLDANGSWRLEQAVTFALAVGLEGIDYIEEPLAHPQEQVFFYQATGMPIALDESLVQTSEPALHDGLKALVIKPAVLGPLERSLQLIAWGKRHGLKTVLSSVFESATALRFYARLACQAGIHDTAHGLDTWRWFSADPQNLGLTVRQGCLWGGGKD